MTPAETKDKAEPERQQSLLGLTKAQRGKISGHLHYIIFGLKILRQDLREMQLTPLLDEESVNEVERVIARITAEIIFLKLISPEQYRNIKKQLAGLIHA